MYKRTDWGHIRVNEIDEYIDALVYPMLIVLPEEIKQYITCSCGGHEGYQDHIEIGFKVPDISIIENFVSNIRKGLREQYIYTNKLEGPGDMKTGKLFNAVDDIQIVRTGLDIDNELIRGEIRIYAEQEILISDHNLSEKEKPFIGIWNKMIAVCQIAEAIRTMKQEG